MNPTSRPLFVAGAILGMGLAGFFDGIVLHQVLQWHHMVCTTETCQPRSIAELRRQDRQDGFFHLAMYLVTIAGTVALFRAGKDRGAEWSGRVLAGGILAGAGLFNLVEGLVDHQVLRIHHVRPGPDQSAWDAGFLMVSAAMLIAGWAMARPRRQADSSPS